jgi:hypothetical protein
MIEVYLVYKVISKEEKTLEQVCKSKELAEMAIELLKGIDKAFGVTNTYHYMPYEIDESILI